MSVFLISFDEKYPLDYMVFASNMITIACANAFFIILN